GGPRVVALPRGRRKGGPGGLAGARRWEGGRRARLAASAIASAGWASVQADGFVVCGAVSGAGMSEELGTIDDKATTAAPLALRDEDGAVRADSVERGAQAIAAKDTAALGEPGGDLHEADAGDPIEGLEPALPPRPA